MTYCKYLVVLNSIAFVTFILSKQQLQMEDEGPIFSTCTEMYIGLNLLRNLYTAQIRVCTPLENKGHFCTVHGPVVPHYLRVIVFLEPTVTTMIDSTDSDWFFWTVSYW